jgi:xanthine dehydrogenase accessory factor
MKAPLLDSLRTARTARRAAAIVTALDGGAQGLVIDGAVQGDLILSPAEADAVAERLLGETSGRLDPADSVRPLFVDVIAPPPRLVIVGAVHIAQHLMALARVVDMDVTVIDPRAAFAEPSRFPDVTVVADWPDEALEALGLDARCAVVTLTHDPKLDDPALRIALPSPAFYVGALGSRKTHAARVDRLRAAGLDDAVIGRLNAPVGLNIGARTPAEIALSILAEITAARRGARP